MLSFKKIAFFLKKVGNRDASLATAGSTGASATQHVGKDAHAAGLSTESTVGGTTTAGGMPSAFDDRTASTATVLQGLPLNAGTQAILCHIAKLVRQRLADTENLLTERQQAVTAVNASSIVASTKIEGEPRDGVNSCSVAPVDDAGGVTVRASQAAQMPSADIAGLLQRLQQDRAEMIDALDICLQEIPEVLTMHGLAEGGAESASAVVDAAPASAVRSTVKMPTSTAEAGATLGTTEDKTTVAAPVTGSATPPVTRVTMTAPDMSTTATLADTHDTDDTIGLVFDVHEWRKLLLQIVDVLTRIDCVIYQTQCRRSTSPSRTCEAVTSSDVTTALNVSSVPAAEGGSCSAVTPLPPSPGERRGDTAEAASATSPLQQQLTSAMAVSNSALVPQSGLPVDVQIHPPPTVSDVRPGEVAGDGGGRPDATMRAAVAVQNKLTEDLIYTACSVATWTMLRSVLQQHIQRCEAGTLSYETRSPGSVARGTAGAGAGTRITMQWPDVVRQLCELLYLADESFAECVLCASFIRDDGRELMLCMLQEPKPHTLLDHLITRVKQRNQHHSHAQAHLASQAQTQPTPSPTGSASRPSLHQPPLGVAKTSVTASSSSSSKAPEDEPEMDDLLAELEYVYAESISKTWAAYLAETLSFSTRGGPVVSSGPDATGVVGGQVALQTRSTTATASLRRVDDPRTVCQLATAYFFCSHEWTSAERDERFELLYRSIVEGLPRWFACRPGACPSSPSPRTTSASLLSREVASTTAEIAALPPPLLAMPEECVGHASTPVISRAVTVGDGMKRYDGTDDGALSLDEAGCGPVSPVLRDGGTAARRSVAPGIAGAQSDMLEKMLNMAWLAALHKRVEHCLATRPPQLDEAHRHAQEEQAAAMAFSDFRGRQRAYNSLVVVELAAGKSREALVIARRHFNKERKMWTSRGQTIFSAVRYLQSMVQLVRAHASCRAFRAVIETVQFVLPQAALCEQMLHVLAPKPRGAFVIRFSESRYKILRARVFLLREAWRAYASFGEEVKAERFFNDCVHHIQQLRRRWRENELFEAYMERGGQLIHRKSYAAAVELFKSAVDLAKRVLARAEPATGATSPHLGGTSGCPAVTSAAPAVSSLGLVTSGATSQAIPNGAFYKKLHLRVAGSGRLSSAEEHDGSVKPAEDMELPWRLAESERMLALAFVTQAEHEVNVLERRLELSHAVKSAYASQTALQSWQAKGGTPKRLLTAVPCSLIVTCRALLLLQQPKKAALLLEPLIEDKANSATVRPPMWREILCPTEDPLTAEDIVLRVDVNSVKIAVYLLYAQCLVHFDGERALYAVALAQKLLQEIDSWTLLVKAELLRRHASTLSSPSHGALRQNVISVLEKNHYVLTTPNGGPGRAAAGTPLRFGVSQVPLAVTSAPPSLPPPHPTPSQSCRSSASGTPVPSTATNLAASPVETPATGPATVTSLLRAVQTSQSVAGGNTSAVETPLQGGGEGSEEQATTVAAVANRIRVAVESTSEQLTALRAVEQSRANVRKAYRDMMLIIGDALSLQHRWESALEAFSTALDICISEAEAAERQKLGSHVTRRPGGGPPPKPSPGVSQHDASSPQALLHLDAAAVADELGTLLSQDGDSPATQDEIGGSVAPLDAYGEGSTGTALRDLRAVVENEERMDYRAVQNLVLSKLAEVYNALGMPDTAIRYHLQVLEYARQNQDMLLEYHSLLRVARLYTATKAQAQAQDTWEKVSALAKLYEDTEVSRETTRNIVSGQEAAGLFMDVIISAGELDRLARGAEGSGAVADRQYALEALANAHLELGQYDKCLTVLDERETVQEKTAEWSGRLYDMRAKALYGTGDCAEALKVLQRWIQKARHMRNWTELGKANAALGAAYARDRSMYKARRCHEAALVAFSRLGCLGAEVTKSVIDSARWLVHDYYLNDEEIQVDGSLKDPGPGQASATMADKASSVGHRGAYVRSFEHALHNNSGNLQVILDEDERMRAGWVTAQDNADEDDDDFFTSQDDTFGTHSFAGFASAGPLVEHGRGDAGDEEAKAELVSGLSGPGRDNEADGDEGSSPTSGSPSALSTTQPVCDTRAGERGGGDKASAAHGEAHAALSMTAAEEDEGGTSASEATSEEGSDGTPGAGGVVGEGGRTGEQDGTPRSEMAAVARPSGGTSLASVSLCKRLAAAASGTDVLEAPPSEVAERDGGKAGAGTATSSALRQRVSATAAAELQPLTLPVNEGSEEAIEERPTRVTTLCFHSALETMEWLRQLLLLQGDTRHSAAVPALGATLEQRVTYAPAEAVDLALLTHPASTFVFYFAEFTTATCSSYDIVVRPAHRSHFLRRTALVTSLQKYHSRGSVQANGGDTSTRRTASVTAALRSEVASVMLQSLEPGCEAAAADGTSLTSRTARQLSSDARTVSRGGDEGALGCTAVQSTVELLCCLNDLYDDLWSPIDAAFHLVHAECTENESLIIVPDASLLHVPFPVLLPRSEPDDTAMTPLGVRYTLVVTPSLAHFAQHHLTHEPSVACSPSLLAPHEDDVRGVLTETRGRAMRRLVLLPDTPQLVSGDERLAAPHPTTGEPRSHKSSPVQSPIGRHLDPAAAARSPRPTLAANVETERPAVASARLDGDRADERDLVSRLSADWQVQVGCTRKELMTVFADCTISMLMLLCDPADHELKVADGTVTFDDLAHSVSTLTAPNVTCGAAQHGSHTCVYSATRGNNISLSRSPPPATSSSHPFHPSRTCPLLPDSALDLVVVTTDRSAQSSTSEPGLAARLCLQLGCRRVLRVDLPSGSRVTPGHYTFLATFMNHLDVAQRRGQRDAYALALRMTLHEAMQRNVPATVWGSFTLVGTP